MFKPLLRPMLLALPLVLSVAAVQAQAPAASVQDAWVRGTVAQQKASGAFMTITSPVAGRLVSASSPVAGVTEIHEMAMDGDVMKMRAIPGLELPAGKPVELKPGGYHVMLMDLKKTLAAGDTVPVSLVVEGRDGKRETIELKVAVRSLSGTAGPHKP